MINSTQSLIEFDEGRRAQPYQDSLGIWSVGVGHNLEANPIPSAIVNMIRKRLGNDNQTATNLPYPANLSFVQNASGLWDEEIDALYNYDLGAITGFLDDYPWFESANGPRQGALRDMAFNLGSAKFHEFDTFLMYVANGEWQAAANDLRTTAVYHELTDRYERLAQILESGNWPSVA